MKKLALGLVVVLMLIPAAAMAMETISDADLEGITGQSGVTIEFRTGNMEIDNAFQGISWGDDDGFPGGAGVAGHIRIDCLTTAGAADTMSTQIIIAEGQSLVMDVDDTDGIVLSLPDLTINMNTPGAFKISVAASQMTTFAAATPTGDTIGWLGLNNLQMAITTPTVLCIKPH